MMVLKPSLVVPGDDGMQSEYLKLRIKKIKTMYLFNNYLEGAINIVSDSLTYVILIEGKFNENE